ncbi:PA14 domain-containing protein [Neolewinella litorea]|uniref:PA14 domain-containing protein n=1 Tax=Neolewinella litorea TaxID=2562452 RepID=A0A4S4NSE2_9BACT|nr:PA14 domain-containing protein [Neolewinella litorea]THH41371.1 hypothetical protein E4021_01880 [Neolewinella litorea]
MLKYILFVAVLGLAACTSDPLEVETIDTTESAPSDGLDELELARDPAGWTMEDGVLTATAPAELELLPEHKALTLAFSFRLDEAGEADLLLGGQHALHLPSLDLDLDSTVSKRSEVKITPGVWQNLEVAYLPAEGEDPALLVATYLNGNLIYYQQPLPAGNAESGSLSLKLTAGTLSLTNLRTSASAGRASALASNGEVELNLPLIRYAYYDIEGNPEDITDYESRSPAKEGYISRFDLDGIREKGSGYALRFTSDLEIPKAGEYTFRINSPSSTRLYIDDELVVDMCGRGGGNEGEGTVSLGEGSHRVRLDHYQFGGWNHLKIKYAYEDQEPASFNDMPEDRAVATPRSGDAVEIAADDRPYLLRSFLNFPPARVYDFTDKRTHVVNVGEADGPHYSYDLRNGSLLQAWRGKFLDVSEMWVERGEPQVARALGPVVAFDGRPQWSTEVEQWPERGEDFRHLRYELDAEGRPTFYFSTPAGGELSDEIVPTDRGLQRTLTNRSSSETLLTSLAAGTSIRETGKGTFELVDPGLNVQVTELAAGGLRLLRGQGNQRLVAEIPPGEHITYSLDW